MPARLLGLFLDTHDDSARVLREVAAAGDLERLRALCHTLKGVLGSIDAAHGAMLASDAYQAATAGEPAAFELATRLAEEMERLRTRAAELLPR